MRLEKQKAIWDKLIRSRRGLKSDNFLFQSVSLNLTNPVIVLGGRNGAGKTRILKTIDDSLKDKALMIDIHDLSAQILRILRSRTDIDQMREDYEPSSPRLVQQADIGQVIGKDYESIEWYSFELDPGPTEKAVAEQLRWGGEQVIIPYFRVRLQSNGFYCSTDMGLGEFSVHLFFWIIDQYEDVANLTLLLDEPDSFFPPSAKLAFLYTLLSVCLKQKWKVVLSTHSSELITKAFQMDSFIYLDRNLDGQIRSTEAEKVPTVIEELVSAHPVRYIFFVEDESAKYLGEALIKAFGHGLGRESLIVWGKGYGYMKRLLEHVPDYLAKHLAFVYLFDGDIRCSGQIDSNRCAPKVRNGGPVLYLPSPDNPDKLYKSLKLSEDAMVELAGNIGVGYEDLVAFVNTKDGLDEHDWVNMIAEQFGREKVLRGFAEVWCARNEKSAAEFHKELIRVLKTFPFNRF